MNKLLIFTSAGYREELKNKIEIYDTWQLDEFDSVCVKYNADIFKYNKYFDIVLEKPGFKFENFFWLVETYNLLSQYDYFGILDDDLILKQHRPISNILKLMIEHNLDICSPSCDTDGKQSWYEIMNTKLDNQNNNLYITNFCEMGAMFLSKSIVTKILEERKNNLLYKNLVDYGMDHFICNIADRDNMKCGLVKNITYINHQPISRIKRFTKEEAWSALNNKDLGKRIKPVIKNTIAIDRTYNQKNKFLICISSFRRPLQVLGQIHRFNKQSYSNIDISVVIRGCDQFVYDLIKNECSIYDNVIINKSENKDQLNNILDCIRQSDKLKYDYFCKVDDDDIYSLDYLKNINEKINQHNKGNVIGFKNTKPLSLITDKGFGPSLERQVSNIYGNTLGFNLDVYNILEEICKDRASIKEILTSHGLNIQNAEEHIKVLWKEDKLIDHIMGAMNSIYLNIDIPNQVYYCKLSPGTVSV